MTAIQVGRIVTKVMGREAGKKAVIVQLIDRNFAEITGPFSITGVKRRRVNINHIEPSEHLIKIPKGADDSAVEKSISSNSEIEAFLRKQVS